MICRREKDGWLLITQPAHAWLAGELAAIWGNAKFARPAPFDPVVLATHLHDIGWMDWDTSPRLGAGGHPVSFLETTLDETIPIWQSAVRQVSLLDPYAALLVSMHASTIYRGRLERKIDPPGDRLNVELVLAEHEAVRSTLRKQLSVLSAYASASQPEQIFRAYRWLRVCDLLSLALCADFMPQSGEIESVPGRDPDELINVNYSRPNPFELHLDPFPFKEPSIQMTIQSRRLADLTYTNHADYLTALESSPWVPQTVRVSGG